MVDAVKTVYRLTIRFLEDVLGWAGDLLARREKEIRNGNRIFYVDVDVDSIPPSVIPRHRLNGARKVSLGIVTDQYQKPQAVDRVFIHNDEDDLLKDQMRGKGAVELVL